MSFRSNMDSLWISYTNKNTSLFLIVLTQFIILIVERYFQIDPFTFLTIALILLAVCYKFFYALFYNSLGRGYENLIKVYKPNWMGKERRKTIINYTLFTIGLFVSYYYFSIIQNFRFAGPVFFFLAFIVWVFFKLYERVYLQKITEIKLSKNYFSAIVLTNSQFIFYSKESGVLKF